MNGGRDESGSPYIPERYRQQIAARKRRQTLVKLAAGLVIVILAAAVILIVSGPGTTSPAGTTPTTQPTSTMQPVPGTQEKTGTTVQTVPVTPGTTAAPTGTIPPATTSATSATGIIVSPAILAMVPDASNVSYENALLFIREDYPSPAYTVTGADIRDQPPAPALYAFSILPAGGSTAPFTAFLTVAQGGPYTPGQESATVPLATARNTIADSFPGLHPDQTRIRYITGSGISLWNFTFFKNSAPFLSGSLDANTGLIRSFSRAVSDAGRPVAPAIDSTAALRIADAYISDHDGPLTVNETSESYQPGGTAGSPVAGQYVIVYNRMVDGYPCDVEGFTFAIDSLSGNVTGYERRWDVPGFAFEDSPVPAVLKRDATYTVLKKAQDLYPGLSSGVSVISTDIRWKDDVPAGTVPKPSAIPLAWKVVFDDELIRAMPAPVPAVAWVDVQSGNLIAIDYKH